jgi:hypothetical protein
VLHGAWIQLAVHAASAVAATAVPPAGRLCAIPPASAEQRPAVAISTLNRFTLIDIALARHILPTNLRHPA